MKFSNTKSAPEVFYGLHMVEGTAEYAESGKDPLRIYIGENAIKNMNPTFQGKPVYVDHVNDVNMKDLEEERELGGVVVRSFFNKADGKNWTEFVVFTDEAKAALRQGWRLSNAYIPKGFAGGGENHGVAYDKEVTSGEYEHLAIVQNPRYEESIVLTPEEFKNYNEEKEAELIRLANSKGNEKEKEQMKFNLFKTKKEKLENALDGSTVIEIAEGLKDAKGKAVTKEVPFDTLINSFTKLHNMHGYANGDHMVKVGEEEMSVNDLVKKHIEACNSMKEMNETEAEGVEEGAHDVGDRGGDMSLDNEGEGEPSVDVDNEADEDMPEQKEKKKNAKTKTAAELAAIKAKNDKLRNARASAEDEVGRTIELASTQVARGRAKYGS